MKTPLGSASIAAADTALSSLEPHSETGASTPPINSLPNGSSVPSRKRKTQDALGDDVPQKNPKSVSSSSNAKPQSKMPTAKSYPPTSTRLADRGGLGGTRYTLPPNTLEQETQPDGFPYLTGDDRALDDPVSAEVVATEIFSTATTEPSSALTSLSFSSPIACFQQTYPDPLTPAQLSPLHITYADFFYALPSIQPSSTREGFASVPRVSWDDVGALAAIRDELHMAIVQPIRHPNLFAAVGTSAPAGVLLWGPPGCGKTLLAKAVARPELLNKYVGESQQALRQVFSRARASAPCVVFFEKLDALVPRRDGFPD
ncbi:hypothetical protein M408DRAFT_22631 [Serendipita vermifera MAFF 305830]|uniref:ATPase AAA-type core domain-containing protein n=1 Tax=Serendipita vermifera MAFF 305830 TaxID=933852 RepID=A0A0C2XL81_SERVB|nr:hypothetical protein M408DRAFT_22631 [Serendipita vermifera MAFF 305830]